MALNKAYLDSVQQLDDGPPLPIEHRLLAAILNRAMLDATGNHNIRGDCRCPKLITTDALEWLNDDSNSTFSAHWICDQLNLSIEDVRHQLSLVRSRKIKFFRRGKKGIDETRILSSALRVAHSTKL